MPIWLNMDSICASRDNARNIRNEHCAGTIVSANELMLSHKWRFANKESENK